MPVCCACLSSRPPIPRPPPSDPGFRCGPPSCSRWLRTLRVLKLATVGKLRIERFRLGQAVAGIPIEATLEGTGPLTDFRSELESTLYRPQTEKAEGAAEPLLALSGALSLGNEGKLAVGRREATAARRAARRGGGAGSAVCRPCRKWRRRGAQGAQDAQEQGSLRLLLTLAGARFSVPELMAEVPGRAGCRARALR